MRKAIRNTKRLLAFWLDGAPCKNKDEYGYSITLTKRDDTGTWKRKHQIAASGELTVAYEVNTIREFHENLNEKWHWTGWYIHYGLLDEPDSGSHRLPMLHHTTAGIKTTLYENSMHMMCRFDKDLKLLFSFFFIFFFLFDALIFNKAEEKMKIWWDNIHRKSPVDDLRINKGKSKWSDKIGTKGWVRLSWFHHPVAAAFCENGNAPLATLQA